MVLDTLKRARGERHVKQLLKGQYKDEELEALASTLYPLSDRIGEDGLEQIIGLSSQLTRYSEKKAVQLLELAPEIIERLLTCGDAELVLLVYELARKVAGDTTFVAARLLEESPDTLEHVLVYGDLELMKRVVKLCLQVAEANGGTAVRLLELSPELIESVGYKDLEKVAELAARVARDNSFVAARMLGMSADLIDRLGYDGLQDVVTLSMESAHVNRSIAVRLLEQSPALIDRVGYDGLKEIAQLSRQVARYSWRTAVTLLGMGPELIDRVGYTGLEELALLCSEIARDDSFVAARLLEMSPELIDKVGSDCLKKLAYLTTEVNKDDGFIAAKVLDESPELIAQVLAYGDDELMTSVYALCCQVSDNVNWRTAVRLLVETPELVRLLHSYGDAGLVKDVYALCNRVATYSGSTAVSLLEQSPALVDRVGYEGFEEVATRAAELTGIDEGRATSFVRGESTESAQFMETIARGLELKKIKHILATYLNALLGYQIELVEAQSASTDGKRIFLPEYLQEFSDEARNFTLYKVLATHEEAHLEYGSFDFELMTVRDLVTSLRAKYGERV